MLVFDVAVRNRELRDARKRSAVTSLQIEDDKLVVPLACDQHHLHF